MSFILDALKKSESERQRRREPTIADIPYGRPRPSQALWMGALIALLLLNLGMLLFVWWPEREQNERAAAVRPAAPADAPAALPVNPPLATEVRPLAAEALAPAEASGEAEPETESGGVATEPKLVRAIAPVAAAPRVTQELANVPTLAALGGAGALNLPELHLDIHVYSAAPAERFVLINMRKYTEGQALQEGPTVQRIAADGVVLDYGNRQFLLPRQ